MKRKYTAKKAKGKELRHFLIKKRFTLPARPFLNHCLTKIEALNVKVETELILKAIQFLQNFVVV
jgi:hypothetical protein